jgi:beta-galactosidase
VEAVERAGGGAIVRHEQRFHSLAGGGVRVEETVVVPAELADLARVGVVMETVPGLERLEWFGRGPVETYPDRRRAAAIARWNSTAAAEYVPYVRPQENGGHADVRWLEVSDGAGRGFRLVMDEPRQVSATHFRDEDLATAAHDVELVPRSATVIHVDAAHRGLGTASCGPDTLPRYMVGPGTWRWTWTIEPLR